MTKTTTRAPRIMLSHQQLFALHKWLAAYPFAEKKPTTVKPIMEEAIAALGFPMTENNFKSAMDVVGAKLHEPEKPVKPPTPFELLQTQVEALSAIVKRLTEEDAAKMGAIQNLAREQIALCKFAGIKPTQFTEILASHAGARNPSDESIF